MEKKMKVNILKFIVRMFLVLLAMTGLGYGIVMGYESYSIQNEEKYYYEAINEENGSVEIMAGVLEYCMENSKSDYDFIFDQYEESKYFDEYDNYVYGICYKKAETTYSNGYIGEIFGENVQNVMGIYFSNGIFLDSNKIVIVENSCFSIYDWEQLGDSKFFSERGKERLWIQLTYLRDIYDQICSGYSEDIEVTLYYQPFFYEDGYVEHCIESNIAYIAVTLITIFLMYTSREEYLLRSITKRKRKQIVAEIPIAFAITSLIALCIACNYNAFSKEECFYRMICAVISYPILYMTLSNVVIQIRNRTLVSGSWLIKYIVCAVKEFLNERNRNFIDKISAIVLIIGSLLAMVVSEVPISYGDDSYMIIGLIMAVYLVLVIMIGIRTIKKNKAMDEVHKRIDEIHMGDYEPKSVDDVSIEKELLEKINEISSGFKEAVKKEVSSERMKVELITNVSHDLKTPLTSIISYIDLLKTEEMSDVAKDYVKILEDKSNNLKNIVLDLFEMAKAASGEQKKLEKLDGPMLLRQVIADMSDIIEASGKKIKLDITPEEYFIEGDSNRLYRVMQNTIDNAIKYSLDNSRIFIMGKEASGRYNIMVKNVSAYEIDFTPDEVMERFVRGDKSRTTEGNGLGLAIAKSFVEGSDGEFKIDIDGDVFCVNIFLNEYKDKNTENEE